MQKFTSGTKILAGTGAAGQLKEFGLKRLFLVADPYFAEKGVAQKIAESTGAEAVEIFRDVQPDPTVALAAAGTARVKAFAPDGIVALGGGSAMDCAKAMAYFSDSKALLIAIPTTSGSGSEVTDFAILTHDGVKHPLVDGRLRPDVAILDDDLLGELPKTLVADAGFDVLAHALEALVAKNAGAITDALAKEAFCKAYEALPASYHGDRSVRLAVHLASAMAGMAFTEAGLGLCHAMAHSLGGMFHIPHGRLNAILLPAVVERNAAGAGEKYAALARAAGLGGSGNWMAVRNLKNALLRLRRELALPATLAEAGVDIRLVRQNKEKLIAATLEDPCCATNPVPVDGDVVEQILREVSGG